jgi:hypothetical protein
MFKVTGNPTSLTFPLDRFTLVEGDSEHKTIPERALGRLRNMAAVEMIGLEEVADPPLEAATPSVPDEAPAPSKGRSARG